MTCYLQQTFRYLKDFNSHMPTVPFLLSTKWRNKLISHLVLCVIACGQYCNQCDTNGASKCDAGQCTELAAYVESSQTCEGKGVRG